MAKGKGKGSKFERQICGELSRWFSYEKADDWFWRAATSGGRATVRAKGGKSTRGHYGDIAATCPAASVLLDVAVSELKCGYNRGTSSIGDVLDKLPSSSPQLWEEWLHQARESWRLSGSFAWMLITKRDGRVPLVFFPEYFWTALREVGAFPVLPTPYFYTETVFHYRASKKHAIKKIKESVAGTTLKQFLLHVEPEHIHELAKSC